MSPTVSVLRWIGVLPAAALGGFLAYILIKVFNYVSNIFSPGGMPPFLIELVSNFGMGFAFTYCAGLMAPRSHKLVGIIAATVFVTATLVLILLGIGQGMLARGWGWSMFFILVEAAGAIVAASQMENT